MRRVNWRTLANKKADGYTYASMNLSSRLMDLGILSLEDNSHYNVKTVSITAEDGIQFIKDFDSSEILINNCLPPEYSYDAEYVIGFTYWETSQLPGRWVNYINRCNEAWTTSAWAKDVFINSGVNVPVYNFELGVDTNIFQYKKRETRSSGPFTFIHVGSPSTRKNTQLVVDAFHKLFQYNTDYKLIIKSNGPPDARHIIDGHNFGSLYNKRTIEIVDHYLTDNELCSLFSRSDCMVYPTSGEGWGMAPFQAIATGLPTICTNATACTEFASLSVPLEAPYLNTNQVGIYSTGQWAVPNIDDVCDRMLYVVNNYDEAVEKTKIGSQIIHEKYSWDRIVIPYMNRILEIDKNVRN